MPQPKFSLPQHHIEQAQEALLAVKQLDGWTDEALGDLIGVSRQKINQLCNDWTRLASDTSALGIIDALRAELWKRGNTRMVEYLRPEGVVFATRENGLDANAVIDDECADGQEALAKARCAHRAGDPNGIAEAREKLRSVEKRIEKEEALLRQRVSGATVLRRTGSE